MSHRTRLVLFYSFVILFLALGGAVLAYSYGWRIDLETRSIQKIGAIYVKTNLRDVTITINGKRYKDTSGILQSGTLISNLLPKTYRVEITKTGYRPYRKTLTVQPAHVTEMLNVQLIPETFSATRIAPTKGTQIIDVVDGANTILLRDKTTGAYYVYDKTNASSTFNLSLAITNAQKGIKIKKIMFVPFKSTQFIIEEPAGLKLFDRERRTMETLVKGQIAAWSMQRSTIVGAKINPETRKQEVFAINLVFRSTTTFDDLNTRIATSTRITALAATDNGAIAFSDAKRSLFLFNQKTKVIEPIADNAHAFVFSPDGKKLAFLETAGVLQVIFIEDFDGDIRKKAGERILVALPQEEPIKTVQWHADSYHLLIEWANKLSITELDDRKPRNTFPLLAEFLDNRYVSDNNSVYFTEKNTLNAIRIGQ